MYDFSKLDVVSIMVKTSCGLLINEVFKVSIKNVVFRVRVVGKKLLVRLPNW